MATNLHRLDTVHRCGGNLRRLTGISIFLVAMTMALGVRPDAACAHCDQSAAPACHRARTGAAHPTSEPMPAKDGSACRCATHLRCVMPEGVAAPSSPGQSEGHDAGLSRPSGILLVTVSAVDRGPRRAPPARRRAPPYLATHALLI